MKKNIHKNLWGLLQSKSVLAVAGGMLMMSCGVYTGGYSETDGVYYDPNTDTLPEGVVMNDTGNRVGDYYDYQASESIIEKSRQNELAKKNRYRNENWTNDQTSSSDWGSYTGSETNYSSWGGYPFYGFGYGYPRFGGYFGMSFGWGNPWGYYDPFFDFSPWGYNSFYGYYPYGYSPYYFGYNPYYGYYSPYSYYPYYGNSYYSNYYRAPQRKSGADGFFNNSGVNRTQPSATMRSGNTYQRPTVNDRSATQPRMRGTNTYRTAPTQRQAPQPRYENRTFENRSFENRTFENRSYDSGRSGGFNSGSSGGSSRGSGMRTGGGRF